MPIAPPRRRFLAATAALGAGTLLPVAARAAQATIHALAGEVLVNGRRIARDGVIAAGDTVYTKPGASIWFTLGGDAFFLREDSELRLETRRGGLLVDALRLLSGALGATFASGRARRLVSRTVTIGIRGTGVYLEASGDEAYACTCFGATEFKSNADGTMMESVQVVAGNHFARLITRDPGVHGMRIAKAPFERHTSAEMARLEALAGRPDPFPKPTS